MFAATVSSNSMLSWLTSAMVPRSDSMVTRRRSWPSMVTRPRSGSKKRKIRLKTVVLPAPDGPTRATLAPAGTAMSKRLSAGLIDDDRLGIDDGEDALRRGETLLQPGVEGGEPLHWLIGEHGGGN